MSTVLEARACGYQVGGHRLVTDVDLDLLEGEVVAIVGPNGAGKSTLFALLAGDLTVDRGVVTIAGRPVDHYRPRDLARLHAVLPQRTVMSFPFVVVDVVRMGRHPFTRRGQGLSYEDETVVHDAMRATDVEELAHRSYTTLSGGEQTRVNLARVLAQRTPMLLLDEPTTALDLKHQHDVMSVCRTRADDGAAVAIVLHDLALAAAWADRVAVMQTGRVVAIGSPREVLTPSIVTDVFEHPVVVLDHPREGWPVVLPAARACSHQPVPRIQEIFPP